MGIIIHRFGSLDQRVPSLDYNKKNNNNNIKQVNGCKKKSLTIPTRWQRGGGQC